MNTKPNFINSMWKSSAWLLAGLASALAVPASAETQPATIPFSEIGAKATADYQGNALVVTATGDGVRLRCGFQKLEGRVTPEGLWLESTKPGAEGKLSLVATSLSRTSAFNSRTATTLPARGDVSVQDRLVRFTRSGLTEEYSVSVDGVRQDFVIVAPPAGAGDLRVELALSGARAESVACGARLTLEASGRKLAYSRLRVEDARGRELAARLEVLTADRLVVSVADGNATYPVRVDPTFSDTDWVSLNPELPGANGWVHAIVVDGTGNVYIGGDFTFIGTVTANYIAKWDGSAWSALETGMSAGVYALVVSGNNLYAGGTFTTAGGVPANSIAKWDGSAWSALGSGMDYSVHALAVSGTNLYAGGIFTTAGGVPAKGVAKWDGDAWSALGSGLNNVVSALAVSGTNLYAGGANGIAKWDGSAWSVLGSGIGGIDGWVYALAVSGTNLYAGGNFRTPGGVTAYNIAKWNGSVWSALGSGIGHDGYFVKALVLSGTDLYAGGWFTNAGAVTAYSIAKWNGSAWSALNSGMGGVSYPEVLALAVNGSELYAGGILTTAGGVPVENTAKWNGSAWSALGSGMNGHVLALAVSGTDLYAGGEFTSARGVTANYVAKWNGSAWSALGLGMNGHVLALAVSGTDLYAGGEFTSAGGVTANRIAKWDGRAWSALGSGINGNSLPRYGGPPYVCALAVSGPVLYAGGTFTNAGGVVANGIAKWNGSAWSGLGSGMDNDVAALAVSGTTLYAGGGFTTAGGVTANCIAKWDGDTWSALGDGVGGSVRALAVNGTNLYAGGWLITAGGVAANGIAKWNGSAWSALGSGFNNNAAYALVVMGSDLYAGGLFTTAGEVTANNVAKWDGSVWSALGSGINGWIFALAADRAGLLFVGGDFSLAGTNGSPYIAQANVGSAAVVLSSPRTQTAEAGDTVHLVVNAAGEPLPIYHWYFNDTYLLTCTTPDLVLTNLLFSQSGNYTVVVSNTFGTATSAPVSVNVIAAVERRLVPGVMLMGEAGSLLNVDYANTLSVTPNWLPLDIVSLASTSQYCFDVSEPLPSQRFYRAWQATIPTNPPLLSLNMVPALTLNGNLGDQIRVDGINAIGPTDAWFKLDTVTLTNTSQLYFDVTAPGQPQRLYRLVPVP